VRIKRSLAKGLFLALVTSLIPVAAISAQKVTAGSECKVFNQKVSYVNETFTCVKSGKKLLWKRADVKASVIKPITNFPVGFNPVAGAPSFAYQNSPDSICAKGFVCASINVYSKVTCAQVKITVNFKVSDNATPLDTQISHFSSTSNQVSAVQIRSNFLNSKRYNISSLVCTDDDATTVPVSPLPSSNVPGSANFVRKDQQIIQRYPLPASVNVDDMLDDYIRGSLYDYPEGNRIWFEPYATSGLIVDYEVLTKDTCDLTIPRPDKGQLRITYPNVARSTCIISFTQEGDWTYNPAPPYIYRLEITKSRPTINFKLPDRLLLNQFPYQLIASVDSGDQISFFVPKDKEQICEVVGNQLVLKLTSFVGERFCDVSAQITNPKYGMMSVGSSAKIVRP
jgi:hypothetical protein